jgi:hypothetical protein
VNWAAYRSWWLARLGDEGDVVSDEHAGETTATTQAAFRSSTEDEAARQAALDASDEECSSTKRLGLPPGTQPQQGDGGQR